MTFVGTRLGSHEITALLGKGGMGEVYRARDTKLKREVAIKILPPEFSNDPDRVSRFQREAEVLASLSHPNIATIYDLQEADGKRFLVLEMIEGETLADRLSRGPIPIEEALSISFHICEALEAAHEKGIVHRDLKPANVKITPDGKVKVLDFGLAKVFQEHQATTLSNSPTLMSTSTPGVILGTAAYMSPEQAKGKEADRTSDVWAFGCVLYEMLSGQAVFEGESLGEILAGVIKTEPEWKRLPAGTPAPIRRLLRRCLQKDRKERLQHIGDARIEINEAKTDTGMDDAVAQTAPQRRVLAWISIAAILILVAALFGLDIFRSTIPAPEVRLEMTTPPTSDPVSLAISPDGQKIVFVATSEGSPRLWLRSLDSASASPLAGTDGGFYPFWSPDSRSIGFFANGKLERIDVDGGLVRALANAPNPLGGSWNRDGTIIFTPNFAGPVFRTAATGGEAAPVAQVDSKQGSQRFPHFLPDGRHFLYYVPSGAEASGVFVGQLGGPGSQHLIDADAPAVYAASGHLLFVRQDRLIAQTFDPVRLTFSGNPFPIADRVVTDGLPTSVALSASAAGPVVYRAGTATGQRQFIWFDRTGKEIEKIGSPDTAALINPALSPDGRRLGMNRSVNGNTDIWVLDLESSLLNRFTFDIATDAVPIWSPDGKYVVFDSNRTGVFDLYQKPATGSGTENLLLATPQNKAPVDWSRDGRFILYRSPGPATGFDLWALPAYGDRKAFPVVQTNFEERDGQFSPDGKWIAYQSNESGRTEIVIQPFPGPGGKLQISTNGGAQVRWRPDGKELFYISLDSRLMAVPIRFVSDGQSVEAGAPVPLFATHIGGAVQSTKQQYIVSPDGQKFLMNTVADEGSVSPISVILNWKPRP